MSLGDVTTGPKESSLLLTIKSLALVSKWVADRSIKQNSSFNSPTKNSHPWPESLVGAKTVPNWLLQKWKCTWLALTSDPLSVRCSQTSVPVGPKFRRILPRKHPHFHGGSVWCINPYSSPRAGIWNLLSRPLKVVGVNFRISATAVLEPAPTTTTTTTNPGVNFWKSLPLVYIGLKHGKGKQLQFYCIRLSGKGLNIGLKHGKGKQLQYTACLCPEKDLILDLSMKRENNCSILHAFVFKRT